MPPVKSGMCGCMCGDTCGVVEDKSVHLAQNESRKSPWRWALKDSKHILGESKEGVVMKKVKIRQEQQVD